MTRKTKMSISKLATKSRTVRAKVMITPVGDELGASFALEFDPSRLRYELESADVPEGNGWAINEQEADKGKLQFTTDFPQALVSTTRPKTLLALSFVLRKPYKLGEVLPIKFGNTTFGSKSVSNSLAEQVDTTWVDGSITVK